MNERLLLAIEFEADIQTLLAKMDDETDKETIADYESRLRKLYRHSIDLIHPDWRPF